ncbi:hypothetical protein GQ457_15G026180 [Hibiscus cannabinus]
MAEQINMAEMKSQLDQIQTKLNQVCDETTIPKWWEKQKETMDNTLGTLFAKMEDNQGYMERLMKALLKKAEEPATPETTTNPQKLKQPLFGEPTHAQVTIIDSHEKYSYKPDAPGILASKPPQNPSSSTPLKTFSTQYVASDTLLTEKGNTGSFLTHTGGINLKPKIELQLFEGDNPRGWVKKCEKYFAIFGVPEEQKLEVASMYLVGRAETWFDGYIMQKHRVHWHEFTADICHRFSDKTYTDIIEEFNKLVQKTSVEDYQERFEELKPYMLQQNPHLEEIYFVSSFLSGLKEELRHKVKLHQPKSLTEAYRQAKLTELALEFETRKFRSGMRTLPYSGQGSSQKPLQPTIPAGTKFNNTSQTAGKQSLVEFRRSNNLCFKCGEKFGPGHQCRFKQLNMMEEDETLESFEEQDMLMEQSAVKDQTEGNLEISMNALTGSVGYNTLRIPGTIKGRSLSILLDSGSTHSFIAAGWAKEAMEIMQTNPLAITVANGEKLYSTMQCNKLSWKMQGVQFEHDFRVLQLGGSDMVLGVDWMKKYSPMVMDFNAMTLTFQNGEQQITLQGGPKQAALKLISGKKLQRMAEKDSELTGEIYLMSAAPMEAEIPAILQPLL